MEVVNSPKFLPMWWEAIHMEVSSSDKAFSLFLYLRKQGATAPSVIVYM